MRGRALSAQLNEDGGLSGAFPRHAGKRTSQTAVQRETVPSLLMRTGCEWFGRADQIETPFDLFWTCSNCCSRKRRIFSGDGCSLG